MAEQTNNLQLLDESGILRGINKDIDSLKITVPFDAPLKTSYDASIGGDLTVAGDIISRGSINVVSKDPVLDLGLGDFTNVPQSGGFTVQTNVAETAPGVFFAPLTITAFQSKADAAGDANFTVADDSSLAVGMVVAITNAVDGENDGYYVVKSKAAGVVSVEPAALNALPFVQTDFKTAASQSAKVYNVDLSVLLFADGSVIKKTDGGAYAPGTLCAAYVKAATKAKFQANGAYQAASDVTLDEAYQNGTTITTSGPKGGNVVIAGDQALSVTASGGVSITNTLDVNGSVDIDLDAGGTGMAVDGDKAVTFGSTTPLASMTATTKNGGAITLTSGAAFTAAAEAAVTITGKAASKLEIDGANLDLSAKNAGGNVTLKSIAGTLDLSGNGVTTLSSVTDALTLSSKKHSGFTVDGSGQSLTFESKGGGVQQVALISRGTGATAVEMLASAGGIKAAAELGLALDAKLSSNLTITANSPDDQTLTLKAANSGAGKAFVSVESNEGISLKSTDGQSVVQRVGTGGLILEVKKDSDLAFTVADALIESVVTHKFGKAAGVELTASAAGLVGVGMLCAFDSTGKMVPANAAAGGNSPAAQDEVTRYPFAAAVVNTAADTSSTFQTVPGTKIGLKFDATGAAGGIVGQAVFLGAAGNAGKASLTAPTTSNASIWRVGILAGNVADAAGNYPVYWHPQYLGRRPVA